MPADWRWWLSNFRGHAPSIGLPPTPAEVHAAVAAEAPIAEFGETKLSV